MHMLSIGTDMSKATFHAALDDLSFANSRTQRERGLKRSGSAATSRSPNGLSAGTGAQWSPSGKDDQDDTRQVAAPVRAASHLRQNRWAVENQGAAHRMD